MNNFKRTALAISLSILLAACGGGGGGSSTTPSSASGTGTTPATPATTVVTPANLQATVPAFTYGASSEEFAFGTALNQFRQLAGLGLLAQNTKLDASAAAHLAYVNANTTAYGGTVQVDAIDPATGTPWFHEEQPNLKGFTGVLPADRNKVAGYTGLLSGAEEGSFGGGHGAVQALSGLIATVYHRQILMSQPLTEFGVAVGTDPSQTVVLEMGATTPQSNASDFLGTYPADKQTNVGLHAYVESPNPFPDLSTSNADFPTKTGYPVTVESAEGSSVEVLTFTMTQAGSSTPLDVRLLTAATDTLRRLPSNIAFIVAKAPLNPNTTYQIAFSGRVNNVVVTKNWSFTTGTNPF